VGFATAPAAAFPADLDGFHEVRRGESGTGWGAVHGLISHGHRGCPHLTLTPRSSRGACLPPRGAERGRDGRPYAVRGLLLRRSLSPAISDWVAATPGSVAQARPPRSNRHDPRAHDHALRRNADVLAFQRMRAGDVRDFLRQPDRQANVSAKHRMAQRRLPGREGSAAQRARLTRSNSYGLPTSWHSAPASTTSRSTRISGRCSVNVSTI